MSTQLLFMLTSTPNVHSLRPGRFIPSRPFSLDSSCGRWRADKPSCDDSGTFYCAGAAFGGSAAAGSLCELVNQQDVSAASRPVQRGTAAGGGPGWWEGPEGKQRRAAACLRVHTHMHINLAESFAAVTKGCLLLLKGELTLGNLCFLPLSWVFGSWYQENL